jgi:hypothetical protein
VERHCNVYGQYEKNLSHIFFLALALIATMKVVLQW